MSIYQAIGKARATGQTQMTIHALKDYLNSFHKPYTEKREMVIMTGAGGMEMINLEIEKGNDRDFADFLEQNKIITEEERDRLKEMINASYEDYAVAKEILYNLSESEKLPYNRRKNYLQDALNSKK